MSFFVFLTIGILPMLYMVYVFYLISKAEAVFRKEYPEESKVLLGRRVENLIGSKMGMIFLWHLEIRKKEEKSEVAKAANQKARRAFYYIPVAWALAVAGLMINWWIFFGHLQ